MIEAVLSYASPKVVTLIHRETLTLLEPLGHRCNLVGQDYLSYSGSTELYFSFFSEVSFTLA